MKTCNHNWCYVHTVYEGRGADHVGVVRYCEACKTVQMAFATRWGDVPDGYDLSGDVPFLVASDAAGSGAGV